MAEDDFKAAVGMSREWDAYGAGVEVAQNTLDQLGEKPDCFILFSTIHYKKHGGFQKFLEGVWDVLPKGTPLVGGTVAGFINPKGCFTRGATALAIKYRDMDLSISIGKNTKRAPNTAGRQGVNGLTNLHNSKFKNKLIFDFISGPSKPTIPFLGNPLIIHSKKVSKLLELLSYFSVIFAQRGFGREKEVLNYIRRRIPNFPLVGFSTTDDNKLENEYQFFGKKVFRNSVVLFGISTDLDFFLKGGHGLIPRTKKYKITEKGLWGYMINRIENQEALIKFSDFSGWTKETLDEKRFYRKTFFYPLGTTDKSGNLHPSVIGAFWGNSLVCGCSIEGNEVSLLTISGNRILNVVKEILQEMDVEPYVGLMFSCAVRLESLGAGIYHVKKIIDEHFYEKPYLLVYGAGENLAYPNEDVLSYNASFRCAVIGKKLD